MDDIIPESLKIKLRDRKIIPFVGAGASMSVLDKTSNKPLFSNWYQLIKNSSTFLEKENKKAEAQLINSLLSIDEPDIMYATRFAKDQLGAQWYDFLRNELNHSYSQVRTESLKLSELIWGLEPYLIITTNFDRVLHWTCPNNMDLRTWDIEAPIEMAYMLKELSNPTLWHLHGWIDNLSNIIISPDGFNLLYPSNENIEIKYKAALSTLHQLSTTHSFLFIGFSLNDRNIGLQLKGINSIFKGGTGPHYVLIHMSEYNKVKSWGKPFEFICFKDFENDLNDILTSLIKCIPKSEGASAEVIKKDDLVVIPEDVVRESYHEMITSIYNYDPYAVKTYRNMIRRESSQQYSDNLTDIEFLQRMGYMKEYKLTLSGVLLFTESPCKLLPEFLSSAVTQCVIYDGKTKSSKRRREKFDGSLISQIINARNFIENNTEKWEKPNNDSMQSKYFYKFPMICVREIIANAICHRDYSDKKRMIYIRIFSDRIEIANPGTWVNRKLIDNEIVDIDRIKGEPIHRNMFLSHGISLVNIVEMEGSGIETAVTDCKLIGSPIPSVIQKDGFVIVTIYPSYNWSNVENRNKRYDESETLKSLLESLETFKKNNTPLDICETLSKIGLFYYDQNDYQNSEIYLNQALVISESLGKKQFNEKIKFYLSKLEFINKIEQK